MMATTTATMNAHQQILPLNWDYWDQTPVPLPLQIPQPTGPFGYQKQTKMPSKRFSIARHPLLTRQSSSSLSDTKPAQKKEKMRPEKLPPLIIPRRESSHKALLLQLQIVSVPGAVNLKKTSDQSQRRQSQNSRGQQRSQQPPYRNYQHERVYQPPMTPGQVGEPSSQRIASAQCPVIKPVPMPIPNLPPVPPILGDDYPPNSSATRRLSQVISQARSRSKSRDRRKSTRVVQPEPETPFLASAPYGRGNTLSLGTPFLNDAPIIVEPETPFLALRLEKNIPAFKEEDFLTVMDKHNGSTKPPDSAMTMGSFLSKYKYPPLSNNSDCFVESPARYHGFHEDDARLVLPSQSPKKEQQQWDFSGNGQGTQRTEMLKRSSAIYAGKGGRMSRKDTMSPRLAGNGFSAGGGRPVSLPLWIKTLPTGPKKLGEVDVTDIYAKMDPEKNSRGRERGRWRDGDVPAVERVEKEGEVERMNSFSSAVSDETCATEEQDRAEACNKSRFVSQHEPEQELVDEFGEQEKAALRELLEYVDSILGPTDTAPVKSGVRCAGGDWSREQSWWRNVRRSLQ